MRGSTTRGCCRNGRHPCSSVGGPRQFFLSLLFFLLLIALLHHHIIILTSSTARPYHSLMDASLTQTLTHKNIGITLTHPRTVAPVCATSLTYAETHTAHESHTHLTCARIYTHSVTWEQTHTHPHTRGERNRYAQLQASHISPFFSSPPPAPSYASLTYSLVTARSLYGPPLNQPHSALMAFVPLAKTITISKIIQPPRTTPPTIECHVGGRRVRNTCE